jgi:hypothetical protein
MYEMQTMEAGQGARTGVLTEEPLTVQ